jgi:hypothetical protein
MQAPQRMHFSDVQNSAKPSRSDRPLSTSTTCISPPARGPRKCEVYWVIGEPRALRDKRRTNTARCSRRGMIFSMPIEAICSFGTLADRSAFPSLVQTTKLLEADKTAPPKQRHPAKRIFERLRIEHGYDPDMLTAAASVARLDLVADAGALSVGVDAADTIQASNSLEKMLAHQMGVAHTMAMKFAADAPDELFEQRHPHRSIEAARMANVAARLMETYQRAALTLLRML